MTLEELGNVQGRAWDDVDVRSPLLTSAFRLRDLCVLTVLFGSIEMISSRTRINLWGVEKGMPLGCLVARR